MSDAQSEALKQSVNQLAQQALETSEMGLRLLRKQLESFASSTPAGPGMAEVQSKAQQATAQAELKAKEVFSVATGFLNQLNDRWQPAQRQAAPSQSKSKTESTTIPVDEDDSN